MFSFPLYWLSFSLSLVLFFYILYVVTHTTHTCMFYVPCYRLSSSLSLVLSDIHIHTCIHTSFQAIREPRHTNRCFTNSMRNADWCFKDPCCWMLANTSVIWPNILRAWERITCSSDDILWFTVRTLSAPVLLWTSSIQSRFCYLLFVTAKRRITGQHKDALLEKDRIYSAFDLLFAFRRNRNSNQPTLPWNMRTLQLGCCVVILFFWGRHFHFYCKSPKLESLEEWLESEFEMLPDERKCWSNAKQITKSITLTYMYSLRIHP